MKTYLTERLYIEPTTLGDADFILELMNSPKWLQYIGDRGLSSIQDAQKYIQENYVNQRDRMGFSTFTVHHKVDKTKLGVVGLYDREGVDGIDLGFAFLEKYEGQGYAYEASHKLLQLAFQEFGLKTLKAITNIDNLASQKLLAKLGFVMEGTLNMGDDTTCHLYNCTFKNATEI